MDDSLIAAVYRREPLWDPTHKLHRHVNVLKSLWEEVAEETGRDVKNIKTRWKNLRAYYVKECQKVPKGMKNGVKMENFASTWQYFKALNFLGTTLSSIDKHMLDDNTDDSNSTSLVDVDDSFDAYQEQLYPIVNIESGYEFRAPSPQCKRLRPSLDEPVVDPQKDELERTKIELLQQDAARRNNDDQLFFESLLPYVKDIPLVRKLRLRSAIQDLITKELEELVEKKDEGNC